MKLARIFGMLFSATLAVPTFAAPRELPNYDALSDEQAGAPAFKVAPGAREAAAEGVGLEPLGPSSGG